MDFYEYINRNIIYPFYYSRHNDPRLKQIIQLEKNQFLSRDEVLSLSFDKFIDLLKYAYEHTVYYKEVLNKLNKKPDDFKCFSDFQQLPILTKDILKVRCDDLISDEFNKADLISDSSGGSTGKPTVFYKDMYRNNIRRADQIRHDRWSGWDIGKKYALLWGAPKDNKHYQNIKEKIYFRYVERNIILDAFDVSDKDFFYFTNKLEKYQPSMILGYANLLYRYAKFLNKNNSTHKIRPKGIVSSAETLTDAMRSEIEEAFHCKVFNRYGSREVGLIASECEHHSGLHINVDNIYLELSTHDNKPVKIGDEGNILVTDYYNRAMPIIRYELGDVGVLSDKQCECGRGLPILKKVVGRKSDFFVTKSGKLVHGEYFTHLFYGMPNIEQFQIIQENIDEITVNYSTNGDVDISMIIEAIKEKMENSISVNVNKLDKIMPSTSGKYLFTKSNVSV